MSNFRFFLFTALLFVCPSAFTQNLLPLIKVWEVQGKVQISIKANTYVPLTKGKTLLKGQKILVSDHASLLLTSDLYHYLEIVQPGIYKVDSILSVLSAMNKDILFQQYKQNIIPPDNLISNNGEHCLHFLGRIMRCPQYMSFVGPEYKCLVYDSTVFVHWYNRTRGVDPPYVLFVNNMFQERILNIPTNLHWAWVKLPFSKENHQFIFSVYSTENPSEQCDPILVSHCGDSISAIVSAQLNLSTHPETGFSEIMKANVFEEHRLYLDAMKSYQEAIHRNPLSDYYKTLFAHFLVRNEFAKLVTNECHQYCIEY